MLDICFINPPTSAPIDPYPHFPLALPTLGGMLKQNGFSAEIVDFDQLMRNDDWAENSILSEIRRHVKAIDTKLFGITTLCTNYAIALLIANLIKEIHPSAKVILGGVQASLVPLETLKAFPSVDLIVCGEGELTLVELLSSDFSTQNLQKIDGLAIRVDGKPTFTPTRKLISDLDSLPSPDFSLLPPDKYYDKIFKEDKDLYAGIIEAGRGCPFNCYFCSTSLMWSRKFRVKSPNRVLNEMKDLYEKYGFDRVNMIHDNFTTDPKFLTQFCNYLKNSNLGLNWMTNSRINCLNEGQLDDLAASGCCHIFFGVESASPRMQRIIKKRLKLEGFCTLLKQCLDRGITTLTSFMIGFPEETFEDLEATFFASVKYRNIGETSIVKFNKVAALAGTQIYKEQLSNLVIPKNSGLNYGGIFPNIPEIWDLLTRHPNLFSYAYSIPNPHVSEDTINGLIRFFNAGIWNHPRAMHQLLHLYGFTPGPLWKEWQSWCTKNYKGLPNTTEEAEKRFPIFLQAVNSALQLNARNLSEELFNQFNK